MDKGLHEGEDVSIVSRGCQHQLAVAERVLHSLRHVVSCQVGDRNLHAPQLQLLLQQLHSCLGVAVDGGVGDHNALALHLVGGPDVIQIDVITQILGQYRSVQGADGGDVQGSGLLQQRLYLRAVLAHDADVVAPCLASPVFLCVQCAELAEAVGGEQHLILHIVSHNDLRPVDHRRGDKGQGVFTQRKGIPLTHHNAAVCVVGAEELTHHGKGLGGRNHRCVGIGLHKLVNIGGVVRLHVLDDQIVRLSAV